MEAAEDEGQGWTPMSEYPTLDSVRFCQKCGHNATACPAFYQKIGNAERLLEEFILRSCQRCGYEWREECADGSAVASSSSKLEV